ncbi:MAG: VIT1/CCC1 transporter family protein [Thermotogaceae bacterium]|nr:VIT1/CCC1 transporter family protein [Thermotogaceae bacterium]
MQGKNKEILQSIANDEKRHYGIFKNLTKREVKPDKWKIFWYIFLFKLFGLVFALKVMERGERLAQSEYEKIVNRYPVIKNVLNDEEKHELELIELIKEERVGYISSMVLGLNDAIVELTGALAGFTFALRESKLVGLAGLITGVSAALSMAVSEYLSEKSDVEHTKNPLKAAVYTGIAYILVVIFLILPFFLISNPYISLGVAVSTVVLIIAIFTYYVAVIKNESYRKQFLEMLVLSFSVMVVSFIVGVIARKVLGIEA